MKNKLCLVLVGITGCLASGCAAVSRQQLAKNAALNDDFFNERIAALKGVWGELSARGR